MAILALASSLSAVDAVGWGSCCCLSPYRWACWRWARGVCAAILAGVARRSARRRVPPRAVGGVMTRRKTAAPTSRARNPAPDGDEQRRPPHRPAQVRQRRTQRRPAPASAATHDALKADRAAWAALPPKVDWVVGDEVLQLRDCPAAAAHWQTARRARRGGVGVISPYTAAWGREVACPLASGSGYARNSSPPRPASADHDPQPRGAAAISPAVAL